MNLKAMVYTARSVPHGICRLLLKTRMKIIGSVPDADTYFGGCRTLKMSCGG